MTATRFPLVVEQGATFDLQITYYADERQTQPVDLTGYTARMQIRPSPDSAEIIYDTRDNSSRLFSWQFMHTTGSPSTANVHPSFYSRFENALKYGSTDGPNNDWAVDKQRALGVVNFIFAWIWGQLDAGYVTGPYDPYWDPTPGSNVNTSPPASTACNPITEEQHRLLVGSSYINQVRTSLGANSDRRKAINELWFYQGCCPASETGVLTSNYDKYLASARACNAGIIFDAEGPIKYAAQSSIVGVGGVVPAQEVPIDPVDPFNPAEDAVSVIPPHRLLRLRMRELGVLAGCEPGPQKTASVDGWFQGESVIISTPGYRARPRQSQYWTPRELKNLGKRYIEFLFPYDAGYGAAANTASAISEAKQLISDGNFVAFPFSGWATTELLQSQIEDLVAFDRQSAEKGCITLGGTAGTIKVKIPADTTAAMKSPRKAAYDIELVSPTGDVIRLLEGDVEIRAEVTRG